MDSEDGQAFIKRLSHFVRTHEKALANALQLQKSRQRSASNAGPSSPPGSPQHATAAGGLAAAFSMPSLSFTSQQLKPAKLTLTPHHLYYLLTRFEELNIQVGPMGVRLENIHAESAPANYVSFLSSGRNRRNRSSDSLSIKSVSSVRSVMSGMSSIWNSIGLGGGPSTAKTERAKAALNADLKYLYSAFTKVPCLKLAPDRRARLISGFEEFPFDTAVPLLAFKNMSALEICDIDIRQFFGWDRLAEQLRSLVVKRGGIEDPAELIIAIVLDDMDRRRRRSSKTQASPIISYSSSTPLLPGVDTSSAPPSPNTRNASRQDITEAPATPGAHAQSAPGGQYVPMSRGPSGRSRSNSKSRPRSTSPSERPTSSRNSTMTQRSHSHRMRRSGSGSSHSSSTSTMVPGANAPLGSLPATKWRLLRHLSLSDNGLVNISQAALLPLSGSLTSLDLSSNMFVSIPESLAALSNLRALNLSGNMIDSLHSLTRCPLPAITALNLRNNRLSSIAGVERLLSLERLDLRENRLTDPTELARLTGAPNLAEVWVAANPFTKTHSNYRVTIFNLFRNTPGYTDDILLDSQGPGMVERRSLIDRVAEAPTVPVVKQAQQTPVIVNTVTPLEARRKEKEKIEGEKPRTTVTTEVARSKKRAGRRRVVELTRDDSSVSVVSQKAEERPPPPPIGAKPLVQKQPPATPAKLITTDVDLSHPSEDASSGAESSPQLSTSLSNENVDWAAKGDEYRRKVEALKSEVGSGWLSVLSEEGLSLASSKATPSTNSVHS